MRFMDFYGFIWDLYGFIWIYMDLYGFIWNYMDVQFIFVEYGLPGEACSMFDKL